VGSHLCVSGTNSNNVGCFPIDQVTRLPGTTAVNTVTVTNVRGMRIHRGSGCGTAGMGLVATVQGFSVNAGGTVTLTNTAAHASPVRYGSMSSDGLFAAWGSFGDDTALYNVTPGACTIAQAGVNAQGLATTLIEYQAFDQANRLYISDSLANQIRVFQATSGGFGAPLATSTTNHPTTTAPGLIEAALASSVPVELTTFRVE
jgi:hypothetical protein